LLLPISIKEYDYPLPEEKIAIRPLFERDASKLLVYNKGAISHRNFKELPSLLPENALLVRNITRVVQARLIFTKKTGGEVEVFCLEPLEPSSEMSLAMQQKGWCTWKCMAKKLKRWKEGEKVSLNWGDDSQLEAELLEKDGKFCRIKFTWIGELSWAQVLEIAGKVPLPPYIHRKADEKDKTSYQTIYAERDGAVAAPTAGLHFTPEIEKFLEKKGIETEAITLHVSAGTFQPVEEENAIDHAMHREEIIFEKDFIEKLSGTDKAVICVGTTSLRAIESLYWFGVALIENPGLNKFFISKMQPYKGEEKPHRFLKPVRLNNSNKPLNAILTWMKERNLETLTGHTEIFIFSGYKFQIARGLLTNFHQPQSTLLLLVSAFIGDDWKKVYEEALANDYRFLSYGDSSLLLP
jgi:S-adenosylmethionine:tRNA ribosyltransferase-isomerase